MPATALERRFPAQLCGVCSKIDFDYYLSHRIGFGSDDLFELFRWKRLGDWKKLKRRLSCRFCSLVVTSINTLASLPPSEYDVIKLSNEKSWVLSSEHTNLDGSRSRDYSNRWDLEKSAKRTGSEHVFRFLVSWKGRHEHVEIQYLAHHEQPVERHFYGRRVDPRVIDWDIIRRWLFTCRDHHRGTCDSPGLASGGLPRGMRLIDVYEQCIINALWETRPLEYVALTYVWGKKEEVGWTMQVLKKQELSPNKRPGEAVLSLRHRRIPHTIQDAMVATQMLGHRYLWVDQLCIAQDDKAEQHRQTQRMDAVYNGAALTIAAAAGRHADYGIAGISVDRRYQQPSEVVKGLRFAACFPKYSRVDNAYSLYWNTRGWTLQEKLLSRKLLLFTDYQVYYRCSNAIWTEDVEMEYGRLSNSIRRRPTPFRWAPERQKRHISSWYTLAEFASLGTLRITDKDKELGFLPNYIVIVNEATQRNFTKPKDLVPAIHGMLRTLDMTTSTPFHAGLPTKYLAKTLLWQPVEASPANLRDSREVPSWSWAAWILPDGCRWNHVDLHKSGEFLGGIKLDFICSHNNNDPKEDCAIRVNGARTKKFGIDPRKASISRVPNDVVADFPLVDSKNRCLGEVRTTGRVAWMRRQHTFWAISERKSLLFANPDSRYQPRTTRTEYVDGQDVSTTVDEPRDQWQVLNVMLINRKGGGATRIAVGKVLKEAWGTTFWTGEPNGERTSFILE